MVPTDTKQFQVVAVYDERAEGLKFGIFTTRDLAEQCLLVLAARINVKSAQIEEIEVV